MFVALEVSTERRVTSLDPVWIEDIGSLRQSVTEGRLVCPGCRQPLTLRAGALRRTHFAHRHLSDCPHDRSSPEVCEARAQLYLRLSALYPDAVDLEVPLPGSERQIDLRVRLPDMPAFAYWIFDRSPRNRDRILAGSPGMLDHFVFTQSSLRLGSPAPNVLLLSAAQRDMIREGPYDERFAPGGHLFFLNTEDRTVMVHRGLTLMHAPAHFRSERYSTFALSEAVLCGRSGEIVSPTEVTEWTEWKLEQERLVAGSSRLSFDRSPRPRIAASRTSKDSGPVEGAHPVPPRPPARCVRCGVLTRDWSVQGIKEGTCTCQTCADQSPRMRMELVKTGERGEGTARDLNSPLRCERCGQTTSDWVSAKPGLGLCLCRQCGKPDNDAGGPR